MTEPLPLRDTAWQAVCHHVTTVCRIVWDKGSLCSLVAAFAFSINSLLVKCLDSRVPTTEIVLVRSFVSLLLCAYVAHVGKISPFFGHVSRLPLLFLRGCFGAAAMQTFYLAIVMLPLEDAVTFFFMSPTITAVAAWLILRETLGFMGMGGVLVSLGGLVILAQPPFIFGNAESWDHKRSMGTMFGLLSAVFATGAFISIRLIGKKEQALVMTVWFHSVSLASCIIPLFIGYPSPAVWPNGGDCGILFVIALTSFFGQMILSRGFQLQAAATASAINLTQMVWSYMLSLIFLHASISWFGALGSLLIAGGAILVSIRWKPKPSVQDQQKEAGEVALEMHGSLQPDDGTSAAQDGKLAIHTDATEAALARSEGCSLPPIVVAERGAAGKDGDKNVEDETQSLLGSSVSSSRQCQHESLYAGGIHHDELMDAALGGGILVDAPAAVSGTPKVPDCGVGDLGHLPRLRGYNTFAGLWEHAGGNAASVDAGRSQALSDTVGNQTPVDTGRNQALPNAGGNQALVIAARKHALADAGGKQASENEESKIEDVEETKPLLR